MLLRVRLILCSADGTPLGMLPELTVDSPFWAEVEPVVEAARKGWDIDVVVLRLLSADAGAYAGGAATYLAELIGDLPPGVALGGVSPDVAGVDDARRAPWARPGGVASAIAWADERLDAMGRPRTGPAVQVKSWNLSSILRLPTAMGNVWCKSVPPFLAHEGTTVSMVGAQWPRLVPHLLASEVEAGTVLMDEVPGEDQWEAPEARLLQMVRTLVRVQASWADIAEHLVAAGLPDWRSRRLASLFGVFVQRPDVRARFTATELSALDALLADLPRRLAALAGCGLPETLVHGDFHPGNWRSDGHTLVLLDWGDSGVAHPMFDLSAFDERVPEDARGHVRAAWVDAWLIERPGAEPERAADLIRPIASLRRALIYQGFLDGIEAGERRYHDADVPYWVRHALSEMEWTGRSSPSSQTSFS